MSAGKMKPGDEAAYPYGGTQEQGRKLVDIPSAFVKLLGNSLISRSLLLVLGLKDAPAAPPFADMSHVKLMADMFQNGFSNAEYVNEKDAVTDYFVPGFAPPTGIFASPDAEQTNTPPGNVFQKARLFNNYQKSLRVSNAWVRLTLSGLGFNGYPDFDHPITFHCKFLMDENLIWEGVTDNSVGTSADFVYTFQTTDSQWNGIIPAGTKFRFEFTMTDGLDGTTNIPVNTSTKIEFGLIGLAVPQGANVPK